MIFWIRFSSLNSNITRKSVVSTDFNSYTVSVGAPDAHYYGANINTMTNKPADATQTFPFTLDVSNNGGYVLQTLFVYTADGTPKIYARQQYYDNGNRPFGAWRLTNNMSGKFTVSSITNGHRFLFSALNDDTTSIQFDLTESGGTAGRLYIVAKISGTTVFNKYFSGS